MTTTALLIVLFAAVAFTSLLFIVLVLAEMTGVISEKMVLFSLMPLFVVGGGLLVWVALRPTELMKLVMEVADAK